MDKPWLQRTAPVAEPWTMERALHLALAGVVIAGWALVYMTLMRDIGRPEAARDTTRTAISANLPLR